MINIIKYLIKQNKVLIIILFIFSFGIKYQISKQEAFAIWFDTDLEDWEKMGDRYFTDTKDQKPGKEWCERTGTIHGRECAAGLDQSEKIVSSGDKYYFTIFDDSIPNCDKSGCRYGTEKETLIFNKLDPISIFINSAPRCLKYEGEIGRKVASNGDTVCLYIGESSQELTRKSQLRDHCSAKYCVCAIIEHDGRPFIAGCTPAILGPGLKYEKSLFDPHSIEVDLFCTKSSCGNEDVVSWIAKYKDDSKKPSFDKPIIRLYDNLSFEGYYPPNGQMYTFGTVQFNKNTKDQICFYSFMEQEEVGCVPIPGIAQNASFSMVASYSLVYRYVTNQRTSEILPFHGVYPVLLSDNGKKLEKDKVYFTSFVTKDNWDVQNRDNDIILDELGYNTYYQNTRTYSNQLYTDCQFIDKNYNSPLNGVSYCYPMSQSTTIISNLKSFIIPDIIYKNSSSANITKSIISTSPTKYGLYMGITENEKFYISDERGRLSSLNATMTAVITNSKNLFPLYLDVKVEKDKDDKEYVYLYDAAYSLSKTFYPRSGIRYRDHCYTDTEDKKWPVFADIPNDIQSPSEKNYFYLKKSVFSDYYPNFSIKSNTPSGYIYAEYNNDIPKFKGKLNKKSENIIKETAVCPGLYIGSEDSKESDQSQDLICLVSLGVWDFISGQGNSIFTDKQQYAKSMLCAGIPNKCIISNNVQNIAALGLKSIDNLDSQEIKVLKNGETHYTEHNCVSNIASWVKTEENNQDVTLRCTNGLMMPIDKETNEVAPYQDICLEKSGTNPKS